MSSRLDRAVATECAAQGCNWLRCNRKALQGAKAPRRSRRYTHNLLLGGGTKPEMSDDGPGRGRKNSNWNPNAYCG